MRGVGVAPRVPPDGGNTPEQKRGEFALPMRKKWGFFGISLSWAHLCPMGEVGLDGNEIESERAEELFLVRGHPSPYPYPLPYL